MGVPNQGHRTIITAETSAWPKSRRDRSGHRPTPHLLCVLRILCGSTSPTRCFLSSDYWTALRSERPAQRHGNRSLRNV